MNIELQFKVFDWLRFPLIVGVVFIHAFGNAFDYDAIDFSNLSGMDFYNLFRVCISKVLMHICVPTFYFISGYLFFKGLEVWDGKKYLFKLKRRICSLLIPFLIWNTISILMALQGEYRQEGWIGIQNFISDNNYWHLYWDSNKWNLDRVNWLGGADFNTSPYLYQLWFLRDLMVVSICSPFLYYLFKKTNIIGLLLLSFCYISGIFMRIPGFSTMAFLFFGLGGYLKMNNIDPTKCTYRLRYIFYMLAVILLIVLTFLNGHDTKVGNLIYPFYVISGFISLFNLVTFIVKNDIVKISPFLSRAAFFIYLSHTIVVLKYSTFIVQMFLGDSNSFLLLLSYLIVPVLTVSFCLLIYYAMDKYMHRLCRILSGNR